MDRISIASGSHRKGFPCDDVVIWFAFDCGGKTGGTRVEAEDDGGRYGSSSRDDGYLNGEFVRQQLKQVLEFEIL